MTWFVDSRADAIQRNYGGACVQMRLSFSSLAPFFLYLVQWFDCGCCYALPSYLGLFHILICKVKPQYWSLDLIFNYLLHAMYSSSGFQIWKSLFSSYRFMLMEIAQCQHMNGGQAFGNSMVTSSSGHFVLQPCTDLLWTWSLISILHCSNHLSYLAAAWE